MFPLLLLSLAAKALPQPEPYAPKPSNIALSLAYDAQHGGDAATDAIEQWVTHHPKAPKAELAMLEHRLCMNYGVLVGGDRRVAACRRSVALSGTQDDAPDVLMAEAFRREPEVTAKGTAVVPLTRTPFGQLNIQVAANGATSSWLLDTGMEITAVSDSTAKALGVRFLAESASGVGTSTTIHVAGRLGVIDKLMIGSASVEHVPVLVLPDAMLQMADGQPIFGALGLPVLVAFHKVAWIDRGSRFVLGGPIDQGSAGPASRIYWHEQGLGLPMSTRLSTRGVQFDSGSNVTGLRTSGLKLLTPVQIATISEQNTKTLGLGGSVTAKERFLPRLDYSLAGAPLHAVKPVIEINPDGAGVIGGDAILQLDLLAIDFDAMSIRTAPASDPIRAGG